MIRNKIEKSSSSIYVNRELSWLQFNHRVLELANSQEIPVLEQLRFCEIYISNLDEFYMKRVGGLQNQVESKRSFRSIDNKTPEEQLECIRLKVLTDNNELVDIFRNRIIKKLKSEGIEICLWDSLSTKEKKSLRNYFDNSIYPVLTPLGVDPGHPFPFISNLSKSLGVTLLKKGEKNKKKNKLFIRIKIPSNLMSWVALAPNASKKSRFINIEQVIINNLSRFFEDHEILDVILFRLTRNADWSNEVEDTEDLLEHVEEGIKVRKFAPIVRVEVMGQKNSWGLEFLSEQLGLETKDIYPLLDLPQYTNFSSIIKLDRPELKFKPWNPSTPKIFDTVESNFFELIKKDDILFHHPYESFNSSVERFIQEAAEDPKVLAIKLTLYRTDAKSKIIESLAYAAEKGKQVVCVIELKARFDEEKNIKWAHKLESVGVHVIYGMLGLKIHSKMTLVVRNEGKRLRSYVHVGTGNYNSTTSQFYTDFSLFTAKKDIVTEVVHLFNYLTGIHNKQKFNHLLVAPVNMKKKFLDLIAREVIFKKAGKASRIMAKMNSLEDLEIINALYNAAKAGVKITLFVRGFCCLRPKIPGVSANIQVISIMGRFLEHTRLYYFQNGKNDASDGEFYLGSADWMYRNLNNRVELIVPVEKKEIKIRLWQLLKTYQDYTASSWEMQKNGDYLRRPSFIQKSNRKINLLPIHDYLMQNI
jgi:polyphosphate kinase